MTGRHGNRVALVTGAASGLGEAIAHRFKAEGAKLAVVDINSAQLTKLWAGQEDVLCCPLDVTDRGAVVAAVDRVGQTFGRVDVLANVAGIATETPFLDLAEDEWRRVIDVNLTGSFFMAQAVARQMAAQDPPGGVIINMASKNGITAEVKYAHYNASKAGIILMTKTMAGDLAEYGIRTCAVAPGYCMTPLAEALDPPAFSQRYADQLIPMGRLGRPREIAGMFSFLASEDAGFMNGCVLVADGGHTALDGRKLHGWDDIAP